MKFYSTATVTIATCVHVQYIEIRKGGFVKPDKRNWTEYNSDENNKIFHEFLLSPWALRDKYLTERRILKLFTLLSRRQKMKSVQYKSSPKFKQIFSRARKPHVTAVPKMLTVEAETLWPVYKYRTELNETVCAHR